MKLTDPILKATKPQDKPYKIYDGEGLIAIIQPNGSKWWRFRYRFNGREKMLSLGTYPDVSLKEARLSRDKAKLLIKQGIDPSEDRKDQKRLAQISLSNSFESVARSWWDSWKFNKSPRHAEYVIRRLEADIFPSIGNKPINEISALTILATIKKIELRGASDIAKRALSTCNQIFRYAVVHGLTERNTAADIKPSDALKPTKKTNYARLPAHELPELMQKIESYDGQLLTRLALKLMALTFVRTGELIGASWDEIDLDQKIWRIPAERMKMRTPHLVPLSSQAIKVIKSIQQISSHSPLLFPNERNPKKSMSNNTLIFALYRMGYHSRMTGHGFRGIASTILHEQGYPHEHIELQLAHSSRDAVSASYNHALYLQQRANMMQNWANYLEGLLNG